MAFDAAQDVAELPRARLKALFQVFLESIPARIQQLATLVQQEARFASWQPDSSATSLDALGEWLPGSVSARWMTGAERNRIYEVAQPWFRAVEVEAKVLTDFSLSVGYDIGVYFGATLVRRVPNMAWTQPLSSRRDADYGQPVVEGFRGGVVCNPIAVCLNACRDVLAGTYSPLKIRQRFEYWKGMASP